MMTAMFRHTYIPSICPDWRTVLKQTCNCPVRQVALLAPFYRGKRRQKELTCPGMHGCLGGKAKQRADGYLDKTESLTPTKAPLLCLSFFLLFWLCLQ